MVSFLSPELLNNSQSYLEMVSLALNIAIKVVFWSQKKICIFRLNSAEAIPMYCKTESNILYYLFKGEL